MNIKYILRRFRTGSFLRNLTVVISGAVGAQAIGFLLMPVISRLYNSGEYGVYGAFMSALGVVGAIATLQYNQAVVLPKKDVDSFNLLVVSCVCVLGVALGCGLVFTIYPWIGEHLIKLPSRWVGVGFGLAVLVNGLNLAFLAWSIRVKAFHRTSLSHIIRSLASTSTWLLLGYWGAGAWGLIAGSVIGALLSLVNLFGAVRLYARRLGGYGSLPRMKELVCEYRDFPFYSTPQNLMNALSESFPILFFAHFFDAQIAGAYAFGKRIIEAPMRLILTALRQVLFQRASEIHNQGGDLSRLFFLSTAGLLGIIFLPGLLLFLWAPRIVSFVFGSEWGTAGEYVRWLILWQTVAFCNVPSVLFARILRKQKVWFVYEFISMVTRALALALCGLWFSAFAAVVIFSVLGAIFNLGLIIWIGYVVMKNIGKSKYQDNRNEDAAPIRL